jgi:hypothetical protein
MDEKHGRGLAREQMVDAPSKAELSRLGAHNPAGQALAPDPGVFFLAYADWLVEEFGTFPGPGWERVNDNDDEAPDDALSFLSAIAPGEDRFTFQTFDDYEARKDKALVVVMHRTLADCSGRLTRLSERGAGVFVTVNRTDLKGRKAKNIVAVRALFVDLDGAPLENVDRLAL